jgi:hypothetical protein
MLVTAWSFPPCRYHLRAAERGTLAQSVCSFGTLMTENDFLSTNGAAHLRDALHCATQAYSTLPARSASIPRLLWPCTSRLERPVS